MIFVFAGFELDTDTKELHRNGTPVAIAPKAFLVLAYLVEHRNRMVTKAELLDLFWSENVSEAALQTTISLVRKALQRTPSQEPVIKTYHGRGFRLVSAVKIKGDQTQDGPATPLRPVQERGLVSVLCARLVLDSTSRSADEDARLVADFIDAARDRIQAQKGKLIRMTMDGFTVSFGLDPHLEDGARRAAYCAWKLAEHLGGNGAEMADIQVSFGIETGTVLRDGTKAAWAPPDEIERGASRLAQQAVGGTVHVDDTTRVQLGDEVTCVPVADGFRLTSPPEPRSGIPARPHHRPTGFVGRTVERAFLQAAWTKARTGRGTTITLTGPAGIGKTRLVAEFLASVRSDAGCRTEIRCMPRLQEMSLAPVRQICRALFRDPKDLDLDDRRDRALLNWLLADTTRPDSILESVSDKMRQRLGRDLVLRLLQGLCTKAPLILVVEDVHWIDAESRVYLDAIAGAADAIALLLVVTTRPGKDPAPDGAALHLAPLGHEESLQLLREMPKTGELNAAEAEVLARRAAGNPFFLEELALAVRPEQDVHTYLPETVQAVMEARIADLDIRARTVLYAISVGGSSASIPLIAHLTGLPAAETQEEVTTLLNQGFLVTDIDAYAFRHILLHDTAYAMIAPKDREDMHKRVAQFLERDLENGLVRPETLAWHLQRAGKPGPSMAYWAKASQAAIYRSDRQDAVAFSRNGLSLLSADVPNADRLELSLQLSLGTALMAVEGYGSARVGAALERAHVLARNLASPRHQARIRAGLWVHTWVAGRLPESISHAKALLGMAQQTDDPALLLQAHAGLGAVLVHTGDLQPAMAHLRAGLEHADPATVTSITVQNAAVTCAAYASWVAAMRGDVSGMMADCDRARALSESSENPFARAISAGLCSASFMFTGDVARCHALATDAVELSRKHDFPFWLGTGLILSGWAAGTQGRFDTAFAEIDEGLAVFRGTGAEVQLTNWFGLKAETHLLADQPEQGLEMAKHALAHAKRTGDTWFTPRVHAIAARLCTRLGRAEEAQNHAAQRDELCRASALSDDFVSTAARRG